ncbi:unnamed protein product [Echinostoma caproni]|uniref:Legumain n=1 Tax=Echinostoma caproni TaxID=27848 RepID=A0A183AE56_9TREM|nr:unnamed protein product [Echinostoma caproni]
MRLSLFFLTLLATYASQISANQSKHWAVLVAGSHGWDNYRHQSDVAHAYQLVSKNGIPPQNIITMMVDDVARDPKNPFPGKLFQDYTHQDVYAGVVVDYKGADVTVNNFINMLKGDPALKAAGKKVLESGPNDNVFIYMVDHGSRGRFDFPNQPLQAKLFMQTLVWLNQARRYKQMLIYIEACFSGSMFEGLLPQNIKTHFDYMDGGSSGERGETSGDMQRCPSLRDTVPEDQVHLFQLKRRLSVNQSPEQLELARRRLNRATQLARMAKETVDEIIEQVYRSATPSNPRIDIFETLDCHNTITEQFEFKCFSLRQVPEAAYEMSKLYRLCELGYDAKSVVQEIFDRCG